MHTLIFTPDSFDDIKTAFDWYEEQRAGLGTGFQQSLDATFARMQENPAHFPVVGENGLRRGAVDRYPYHVYFIAGDQMVRIVVVFHTARGPRALLKRLKKH